MNSIKLKELEKGFKRVKNLGYVKSIADYSDGINNDGAVGETFQYYFYGEARDNRMGADWNGWEFKASRESTSSMRSLFTSKPTYPLDGDKLMREKWGRVDDNWPGVKFLMPTIPSEFGKYTKVHIKTHKVNPNQPVYLMRIENRRSEKKISLIVKDINGKLIDDSIYWSYENLKLRWDDKLKNTIFLNAKVKNENGIEYFFYEGATVMVGSKFNDFLNCIDKGLITYDPAHDVYKSGINIGKPHNHGGKFRFKKNKPLTELSSEVYYLF